MLSKIIEKINFQKKIHPATRVFQALRIFVNDELLELENFLKKCLVHLNKKSRIAIVSFHSLEDRIVKRFFQGKDRLTSDVRFDYFKDKFIKPSDDEILSNPRSRSAILRVAEKAC